MKKLTVVLLVVFMMGVMPAFAVSVSGGNQLNDPFIVKGKAIYDGTVETILEQQNNSFGIHSQKDQFSGVYLSSNGQEQLNDSSFGLHSNNKRVAMAHTENVFRDMNSLDLSSISTTFTCGITNESVNRNIEAVNELTLEKKHDWHLNADYYIYMWPCCACNSHAKHGDQYVRDGNS
jgi:hypothetical protein